MSFEDYVASVIAASSKLSHHGADYSIAPFNTAILRLAQYRTTAGISNSLFLIDKSLPLVEVAPSDQSMRLLANALPVLALPATEDGVFDFERRRRDIADAWLNTQFRAQSDLLSSTNAQGGGPALNATTASTGYSDGFAAHEPDPVLREQNFERIYRSRLLGRERIKVHYLGTHIDKFEANGSSLIATAYARSPYALEELQLILDRRVGQDQGSNIMNAVYRALPKAIAASIPRPIPNATKAKSDSQGGVAPGHPGVPAVARPSKVLEGIRQQQAAAGGVAVPPEGGESTSEPAKEGGMLAQQGGGQPGWVWALLAVGAAAGGWVWLRQRGG